MVGTPQLVVIVVTLNSELPGIQGGVRDTLSYIALSSTRKPCFSGGCLGYDLVLLFGLKQVSVSPFFVSEPKGL